jgi:hypothetical protein
VVKHRHQLLDLCEELLQIMEGLIEALGGGFEHLRTNTQPEVAGVRLSAGAGEHAPIEGLMVVGRSYGDRISTRAGAQTVYSINDHVFKTRKNHTHCHSVLQIAAHCNHNTVNRSTPYQTKMKRPLTNLVFHINSSYSGLSSSAISPATLAFALIFTAGSEH